MKTCPNCGNMNADDAKFCEGCGTAFEEKFEEKEVVPQVDGEIVSEGKSFSGDAYSGSGIDAGNGDNINASGFGSAPDNGASPENGASQFGDQGQNSQPNGYGPQESVGQDFSGQPGYGGQNYQGQQGYPQQNVAPQNYPGQGYGGPGYGQQGNYQQGYNQQGYGPAPKKDLTTVCTLALVFGIIGFFCDPFYIITTAAFILGIIGLANNGSKKGQAMAGFICSICATCVQVIFDICTLGIGVFF